MLTVLREGARLHCTGAELQNGDIVVSGALAAGATEPIAVRPDLTDLTLGECNLTNVLLDEDVTLTDVDGTVRNYPAAPHTAGWVIDGGIHHCYFLEVVIADKFRKKQVDDAFNEGLDFVEKFFDAMNGPVEMDSDKLDKAQNTIKRVVEKDPDGVGRLFAKVKK